MNEIQGSKGNTLCPSSFSLRQQRVRASATLEYRQGAFQEVLRGVTYRGPTLGYPNKVRKRRHAKTRPLSSPNMASWVFTGRRRRSSVGAAVCSPEGDSGVAARAANVESRVSRSHVDVRGSAVRQLRRSHWLLRVSYLIPLCWSAPGFSDFTAHVRGGGEGC